MKYLRTKRPVFAILENVPTILAQLYTIKAEVEPLGYVVHVLNCCPTDTGLPERRLRSWILVALSSVISQSDLTVSDKIYGHMRTEDIAPLDEHLLPDDHPLVAAELERRIAPATFPLPDGTLCSTTC